jgi:hypothetical protein
MNFWTKIRSAIKNIQEHHLHIGTYVLNKFDYIPYVRSEIFLDDKFQNSKGIHENEYELNGSINAPAFSMYYHGNF